ncbi:MAG: AarF/ABC1/UbiB kinase family protein [Williamsia sp.]|nr:AarF/ABC1/UbiB kinase family protein [Williamsia sp.]
MRVDLLSENYRTELRLLLDSTKPLEFGIIKEQVEAELCGKLADLFYSFDEVPIASASMGQVHIAYVTPYSKVAVKVQRPGVEAELTEDFKVLRLLGKWLNYTQPQWWMGVLKQDIKDIIEEVIDFTSAELNYKSEATELMYFRQYITSQAYYPKVYQAVSSAKVLTTEFIEGMTFNKILDELLQDPDWFIRNGYDRLKIANTYIETLLQQIFLLGRFQADPHPSNIILMEDGKIGFIDFGITGSLPKSIRDDILYEILAENIGEYNFASEITLKYARPTKHTDVQQFKKDLFVLMESFKQGNISPTSKFQDRSLGVYIQKLTNLYRKHKLTFVSGFVTYLRSTLVYGNTFTNMFPDLNFVSLSFPLYLKMERRKWASALNEPLDVEKSLQVLLKVRIYFDKLIKREERKLDEDLYYPDVQHDYSAHKKISNSFVLNLLLMGGLSLIFGLVFKDLVIAGLSAPVISAYLFLAILLVAVVANFKRAR